MFIQLINNCSNKDLIVYIHVIRGLSIFQCILVTEVNTYAKVIRISNQYFVTLFVSCKLLQPPEIWFVDP